MAEPFASLALAGANPLINNYEKAWDPLKSRAQRMREHRRAGSKRHDDDHYDHDDDKRTPEERGWVLKKRSEVRSDEEIVERLPRNQQMIPYRPGMDRRASSLDRNDYREGRSDRRVGAYRGHRDGSDSDGSVPPRSRVSHNNRSRRSSSKSNSDSEDLGSSTDDERRCRLMKRRKWLTGGLAAVATVHAAASIYNSMEKRDKRQQQLVAGEITEEEARKTRNKGRWQDAAALGVAAIGIRGAVGEWHEVEEKADEHKKYLKQREENHRKRMEKQKRLQERSRGGEVKSGYDNNRKRDQDRDDERHRQRAIKDHGEYDRHRGKSMSAFDDDWDSKALVRNQSRRPHGDY